MMRKLLATTALATIIATGAMAQTTTTPATTAPATSAPAANGTSIFNRAPAADMSIGTNGYITADVGGILASNLIGKPIYNGSDDTAETIGDVNDVLMTPDGTAQAVVIGVGGFLGMGEKEVAVDFSRINWAVKGDERRLVVTTTADELNAAPNFDRAAIESAGNMSVMDTSASTLDQSSAAANANASATAPTAANTQVAASDMTPVDVTTLSASNLIGAHVLDANGDDMGEVSDVLLADDTKTVKAYVVDIGGFLGIGEKPVALAADQLQIFKDANGNLNVSTSFTQEQLGDKPTYSKDAYMQSPDQVLVR